MPSPLTLRRPVRRDSERFRSFRLAILLAATAIGSAPLSAQASCDAWQSGYGAPGPDRPFSDFQVFDDGSGPALYACGPFRSIGDQRAQGVVRWDGARWRQVGRGLVDVTTLTEFDDGSGARLVAGGRFTTANGSIADFVAKWEGQTWVPLAGLASGVSPSFVSDLAAFDDGGGPALYAAVRGLVAGGAATRLARWRGGAWSDVDDGISNAAQTYSLAVYDSGSGPRLYAGIGSTDAMLVRWNGASWVNVAPSLANGLVSSLVVFAGGLFVAHWSSGFPGTDLARFDGSTIAPVVPGIDPIFGAQRTIDGMAVVDLGTGPRLAVAGQLRGAGGVVSHGLVAYDGTSWHGVGPPRGILWQSGRIALASFDDGSGPALFASGASNKFAGTTSAWAARLQNGAWRAFARGGGLTFVPNFTGTDRPTRIGTAEFGGATHLVASGPILSAGASAARGLAVLDESGWTGLLGPTPTWRMFAAFTSHDFGAGPELVAGGDLEIDGSIARWSGSDWIGIGSPTGWDVRSLASLPTLAGPQLFAGMSNGLSRLEGGAWVSAVAGLSGTARVDALCVHDDGGGAQLYAAGDFTATSAAGSLRGVGRWRDTHWEPVGVGSLLSASGVALDLVEIDLGTGPDLYLLGILNTTSGPGFLARWNGNAWSVIHTPGIVTGVAALRDGVGARLVIAVESETLPHVRILQDVGGTWVEIGIVDGLGPALATHDSDADGVPELFAAGSFRGIDGVPSSEVARFSPCGTTAEIECAGDGSATACPCGNSGGSGRGCASSMHANGASLVTHGLASLTMDTLTLDAEALTGTFALFAQGTAVAGGTGVPFQDGLLCAGGVVTRLGSASITNDGASFPSAGARLSQLGAVTQPGQTRIYQTIYRNQASFCTSGAANTTNGLRVAWSR
jgi:hypothetical protein